MILQKQKRVEMGYGVVDEEAEEQVEVKKLQDLRTFGIPVAPGIWFFLFFLISSCFLIEVFIVDQPSSQ
jgi:hypothetical protein